MSRMGEFITRACVGMATRWAWMVLFVALVLTVIAGFAATRLTINTSTREILSADLPFRKADDAYREGVSAATRSRSSSSMARRRPGRTPRRAIWRRVFRSKRI